MIERRREGAVELLRLDRQAVRNALDAALTASSAGSDVKEMAGVEPERRLEIAREKAALLNAMAGLPKPVVAAVHGFALGGGLMLAAACDVVVTEGETRWRLPEVGR